MTVARSASVTASTLSHARLARRFLRLSCPLRSWLDKGGAVVGTEAARGDKLPLLTPVTAEASRVWIGPRLQR